MEAWIVHIERQEAGSQKHYTYNEYSAWASEKHAYKFAAKWLMGKTELDGFGPFANDNELREATRALIEVDKVKEAVALVNKYSRMEDYKERRTLSNKIQITITQSKFLGSVWE